jgi:hypothetical protein
MANLQTYPQRFARLVRENMEMCFGCEHDKCSQKDHQCSTVVEAYGGRYRKDYVDAVEKVIEREKFTFTNEQLWPIMAKVYEESFKNYRHNYTSDLP